MPIHFSLVVLCYKAGPAIVPFIEKLHRLMSQYNFSWQMVLVANFHEELGIDDVEKLKDQTPKIVRELSQRLGHIKVVSQPKKGMMGWDLRTGLDACDGEIIGFIDGDGQFPLEAIPACLSVFHLEKFDLVKTYRVRRFDGFYRGIVSFFYNWAFRLMYRSPYSDVNSKPKIMRRSIYREMNLKADDWFIDAEIMIRALEMKLKVREIPIHFQAQNERPSFVKVSAIIEFAKNMIRRRF